MAYPTLPAAAELCQRIGVDPSTILRATWHRYARSLHIDASPKPARWVVQVEHDPCLAQLLDLHPWEEVSTERSTTWTVTLPDLDLVWSIAHQPTRTVRRG